MKIKLTQTINCYDARKNTQTKTTMTATTRRQQTIVKHDKKWKPSHRITSAWTNPEIPNPHLTQPISNNNHTHIELAPLVLDQYIPNTDTARYREDKTKRIDAPYCTRDGINQPTNQPISSRIPFSGQSATTENINNLDTTWLQTRRHQRGRDMQQTILQQRCWEKYCFVDTVNLSSNHCNRTLHGHYARHGSPTEARQTVALEKMLSQRKRRIDTIPQPR